MHRISPQWLRQHPNASREQAFVRGVHLGLKAAQRHIENEAKDADAAAKSGLLKAWEKIEMHASKIGKG